MDCEDYMGMYHVQPVPSTLCIPIKSHKQGYNNVVLSSTFWRQGFENLQALWAIPNLTTSALVLMSLDQGEKAFQDTS